MVLITALHNSLKWECYSQLCTRLFMKLCWKLWEFFSACILLWKAQAKLWTNLKLLNGIPSKAKSNQVSNQDHDNSGVLDRPQKQFFRNDLFQRLVQNKDICDYCFLCLRLHSSSEILEEGQMNTLRAGGIVTFKTWRYDCIFWGDGGPCWSWMKQCENFSFPSLFRTQICGQFVTEIVKISTHSRTPRQFHHLIFLIYFWNIDE